MTSEPSPATFVYDQKSADNIWAFLKNSSNGGELKAEQDYAAIARLAGHSPYLTAIMKRFPDFTIKLVRSPQSNFYSELVAPLESARPPEETKDQLSQILRDLKSQVSLLIAFMDIHDHWTLDEVTWHLTDFAEKSLGIAVSHAFSVSYKKGDLSWEGASQPVSLTYAEHSGYFTLAMGKMGGYELNYSSDIDLIIFYDPEKLSYKGRKSLKDCLIKLTQMVVEIMDRRTMYGYVFRTDLRLRPDPGSTPIAMTVDAALTYYQSHALNWERSAMIKARPVAGDLKEGQAFLDQLSSWIWRKSMDYEAMGDIIAMKDQINRHFKQHSLTLNGYDVKVGQGGIREIEFFAQINQLLFGGRHPEFRVRSTLQALESLANQGRVKGSLVSDLTKAYQFLRSVEHRIQMVNDEQTHTIPEETDALSNLVSFMGFSTIDHFEKEILRHTKIVAEIYDSLLPKPQGEKEASNLDVLTLLEEAEFENFSAAHDIIKSWELGKYKALQTSRARKILRECTPFLIEEFSKNNHAYSALVRFDKFISKLPAGVQIFSLLQANPSLFRLLARVMSLSSSLADMLAKQTTLWDALLEPDFFAPLPDKETLSSHLNAQLDHCKTYEDILNTVRRWTNEKKFQIAVHILEGLSDIHESGPALTLVADVGIQNLIPRVEQDFEKKYGRFSDGGIGMLALGKYGGKELTFTSDIDVVFLYKVTDMTSLSSGARSLSPSQYFSRLGQHIITAIEALTPEGRLFEVDTRLRPSGSKGPLVVTLKTFQDYYTDAAWTWEHMALTRARLIYAPKGMKSPLLSTIYGTLSTHRDPEKLRNAVQKMRAMLFKEFGSENIWNIKHSRGGLVDLEFIVQYLVLKNGHQNTEIFIPEIHLALKELLRKELLSEKHYEILNHAHWLQQTLQSIVRLSMDIHPKSGEEIPHAMREILCKLCQVDRFEDVESTLLTTQKSLHSVYIDTIGDYLSL
ncbi:bifunctional [glutamine synthetase] adenylyltransferase/[glutamine synthetase]-adenylyl-L-tyrosine phosphorylase [Temperatibacter marinus]|uniref:Bifunctional [glutamine synthetase] adenylyltransferase/[glutamine synthetase]-adenylyl-L-tyrosine phosphorylase n=1 Tax=Temperatibacter marinus TaxID=1456591 RepID=A0AA52H8X5_9PROT|nr:bifunctional [glutamine synthetase] adenylyltransferase/[glutamine synthetase]-adenylyl-L-tyrosine phosphorylase [Temperatibacter marinus]WND02274.1 bifunctional [glutamine synthetase] adenylyltransferase/[glutamine synthetase]-adenylyl-L-tyrosine phosphorylase [Temperatibacter marinus]